MNIKTKKRMSKQRNKYQNKETNVKTKKRMSKKRNEYQNKETIGEKKDQYPREQINKRQIEKRNEN